MKTFNQFITRKVFLGGTCNESTWRAKLIPLLKIKYYNPVVPDWTEDDYKEELRQREICDYCLYVITPRMTGVYSIAEVVDDSNKRPEKTVFMFINDTDDKGNQIDFTSSQIKSLDKVGLMVEANGGIYISSRSLIMAAIHLNGEYHIENSKK